MTAMPSRKPDLDDVLDEFAALASQPDAATLRAWKDAYPQFARELSDFATDWIAMDVAAPRRIIQAEDVNRVVNRTMSRVQTMLDDTARAEPLTDLSAAIRAAGHDFESFERAIGIDRSMLDSLIMRLAKPATLPALLIRLAAEALNRPLDALRDFFRLGPQLAGAHKSRNRPAPTQVDFAMLVRHSQLSKPEQDRWLSEPPDPGLQDNLHG